MAKLQTAKVIKYAAYEVMQNGYVKRSEDEDNCTANKVIDGIECDSISDDELMSVSDYVSKWADYINDDRQSGEYYDSIRAEIARPTVDESKVGLIASSFSSFNKYLEIEKDRSADACSEYLGEEGDTVTFTIRDHSLIKTGRSKYGGANSKWYLYKIHDDCGNVITWFSNNDCDFEFRHCNKVKATISKLSEYGNIKQTCVTKLKWLDD